MHVVCYNNKMENVIGPEIGSRRKLYDECVRSIARISLECLSNNNERIRRGELDPNLGQKDALAIKDILAQHADSSVVIIGASGIGKSTVAQHLDGVVDMDIMFDTMHAGTKAHLLHHEYYIDESGQRKKRTIPFREGSRYAEDLSTTTRQLSVYAEEFFRQHVQNKTPLIGTTPIPADKVVLLSADSTDLLRNVVTRGQATSRAIDYRRTMFIQQQTEAIVHELFDEKEIVVYTMSYE
jgi:energy-coupling factor transporter ATP-binding protein EcfA2